MSFAESPQYKNLYVAITNACSKFGYIAQRIDESNDHKRIIPEIVRGVRQAAFVVADVTEDKAAVYWELGLANGMASKSSWWQERAPSCRLTSMMCCLQQPEHRRHATMQLVVCYWHGRTRCFGSRRHYRFASRVYRARRRVLRQSLEALADGQPLPPEALRLVGPP